MNCFINEEEQIPLSLHTFKSAENSTFTGLVNLTEIQSKNTFVIVVFKSGKLQSNLNFLHQLKRIQRRQHKINIKIGVFFLQFVSIHDLRNLFEWCKEHLIINIFAATYSHPEIIQGASVGRSLHIFTFNPFGIFDVLNVTGERLQNIFRRFESDFQGHQLRLGEPFILSIYEEFWLTVFRFMNASFVVQDNNYTQVSEYFENGIDILPHYWYISNLTDIYVYPLLQTLVIAVPEALPYETFSDYLRTTLAEEWFDYSLFTISAVILLLIIFRYIKQKKILTLQCVADVLNLLMNDNGSIKYQRLSLVENFLIVPLTFVGFVIVNGILSNLQSYLTRPFFQPQINTIEDIYLSTFPIAINSEASKIALSERLTNVTKHKDWNEKIIALEEQNFYDEFHSFNTSNAYCLELEIAEYGVRAKRRLNLRASVRGYHIAPIQILALYGSYYVNDNLLFFERLNEIIFLIYSAGLWDLWLRRYEMMTDSDLLKMNLESLKTHNEVDVEKFSIPMFIVYGWSASIAVLIIEVIWKKFDLSRLTKNVCEKFLQFCRLLAEKIGD